MLYGLLAVVLMAMDHRGQYVSRVRSVAQYAAEPVYGLIEWPVSALRNVFGQFQSQRSLRRENERLQRQLLGLQGRLQRMETLVEENRRLRALFEGAESQPYDYLFAELLQVELDPFAHQVLIDRGSGDGVEPGQAVIDGEGVMGQVEDVHLRFSSVRLISDPSHALPVQINRTGLRTVAFGLGETDRLSLPHVPRDADVREGDLVVTSGLGERFPGGYPVAEITAIDREEGLTFARVEARPLAALDQGREVLLIRVPPTPELEEAGVEAAEEAAETAGEDTGPTAETETGAQTEGETGAHTEAEAEPGADTEAEAGAETEVETGAETEVETGAETEAEAGAAPEAQTEASAETDAEAGADTGEEAATGSVATGDEPEEPRE
jgi:rod shape-determining protein MreC